MEIKIVNTSKFPLPEYQTKGSSGVDLMANLTEAQEIKPMERVLISTGIHLELPNNLEAQIRPRSGLALKYGITVLNSPGTIDADYRGEIKVLLINLGQQTFTIQPGDRIAQMIIAPFVKAEWKNTEILNETGRGAGGYGHTG